MKRVIVRTVICAAVLCGCTSVYGREPENTVLAQVLGVDRQDGVYTLTAAGTDGAGKPVIQRVKEDSLEDAFEELAEEGEDWLSLTGVTRVLLGDGVDPREVLTFIIDESNMTWQATVWYTPIAGVTMGELEDGGVARLEVLEETGMETVTVLDVLVELEDGNAVEVPALMVMDGKLETVGTVWYEMSGGD